MPPPYDFVINDYRGKVDGEASSPIEATHPNLLAMTQAALVMHVSIPLDKIEFTNSVTPNLYDYKIKCLDGRIWEQVIKMDSVTDPGLKRTDIDFWRFSEINLQIPIRDNLVAMIQSVLLTKLTMKFY